MKLLKKKLHTEISEPKLKAYYNLREVCDILNIRRKQSFEDRLRFLFEVNFELPIELKKFKKYIKKYHGKYFIKCSALDKIDMLIDIIDTNYSKLFGLYKSVKHTYGYNRVIKLGEDSNKDFYFTVIRKGKRTNNVRYDKNVYSKKKLLKDRRKKLLNKINKEEKLNVKV